MSKKKKQQDEEIEEVKEVQKKEPPKQPEKPKEFDQEAAEKLAKNYIPKSDKERYETILKDMKEVKMDKFDVMYVTSDKNVFFKENEGSARAHAKQNGLKIFKVKN